MTNNVDPNKLLHSTASTLGLYYWYSEGSAQDSMVDCLTPDHEAAG